MRSHGETSAHAQSALTCTSLQRLQQQQEFRRLLHQHLQQPVQLVLPQWWHGLRCVWWGVCTSTRRSHWRYFHGADALGPPACLPFVSHSWWLYGPPCSLTGLIKSVARSLYKQSELKKRWKKQTDFLITLIYSLWTLYDIVKDDRSTGGKFYQNMVARVGGEVGELCN